ncbi:MAG: DcaP family trimeric outer membrane transporter [Alphaproteobacteria bacterium]|nr:DcaP family trimeric outer membrane transporter [Alphaproteobacteria bacterium]
MKTGKLNAALMVSCATIVLSVAASPGLAGDTVAMRKAALQDKLNGLTARVERLEAIRAAARRITPAAAVESGSKPRSWKLPGTNTSMQIGGFAQLDLIYDINANSGDGLSSNGASGASFPSTGSAAANGQGNFRLHAKRSRFYIRTWTPTDWGELETRIEGDFQGTGGNQIITNSNAFRLRHAYGRLGPFLAGQTNSVFRFGDFEPRVFEDRGPAGKGAPRQGIVSYTHSFGGGTTAIVSVENPETTRAATAALVTVPVVVSGGGAPDRVPDFALALKHKWSSGMVQVGALFGEHNIDDGAGNQGSDLLWGVQAALRLTFNEKRTSIGVLGFYGYGISRAFRGQPAEIAVSGIGNAISVDSVRNFGGYAWIRHQWTETIQTNLAYGRNDGDVESHISKALIPVRTLDVHWTIHANIVYEPIKNVAFAVEYIMVKSQFHNARESTVQRVQFSAVYKF